MGWTRRGTAYCQLIRGPNKEKRLAWAKQYLHEAAGGFLDVIWTDECTVQMETHRRFCCRKIGQPPRNKPRYTSTASDIAMIVVKNLSYAHVCSWLVDLKIYSGLFLCTGLNIPLRSTYGLALV